MIGADVWWPNKDHVSDKPDSMTIRITVPEPLVVASNGRLEQVEEHGDGTRTYHWFVSTPISNYNVALNIAPYVVIQEEYESVTGETFPVMFYVLPESLEDGRALMPEILAHLRWFEETLGPYPFRADKYGVAQTPYLGMEHQSIIAYGANFDNGAMTGGVDWGFDALHHHELSHEWWGNLVTNSAVARVVGQPRHQLRLEGHVDPRGIRELHAGAVAGGHSGHQALPRVHGQHPAAHREPAAYGSPSFAVSPRGVRERHLLQRRVGAAHVTLPRG